MLKREICKFELSGIGTAIDHEFESQCSCMWKSGAGFTHISLIAVKSSHNSSLQQGMKFINTITVLERGAQNTMLTFSLLAQSFSSGYCRIQTQQSISTTYN